MGASSDRHLVKVDRDLKYRKVPTRKPYVDKQELSLTQTSDCRSNLEKCVRYLMIYQLYNIN